MGCLHVHIRKGKVLKVATHDFQLQSNQEQDGILHIEDNKHLTFFDFKTFEKNHAVDREELNDVPFGDRFDKTSKPPSIEGISLCPKCEKPIKHLIELTGSQFVGLQTFRILKKCPDCKFSWIAKVKILVEHLPTYHLVNGEIIPDESTARQDFLNYLQEITHGRDDN